MRLPLPRGRQRRTWPPIPPAALPPSRTVVVPDRGEFFVRDTGGEGDPVLLLHGWMASADLNWWAAYDELAAAGYRVLALDHRGHGRGLRALVPFRLVDCAADAAAILRALELGPAVVVGYSMGGAIAQLFARDHAELARGVVISGTAQHWQDPETKRAFRLLGLMGLFLSIAPQASYRVGMRRSGIEESERTAWVHAELMRHNARDITEAGRELGRFDSRAWLSTVSPTVAVLITTRDDLVPPRKQRELATAAGGPVFESPIRHLEVSLPESGYNARLLEAIAAVSQAGDAAAQAA